MKYTLDTDFSALSVSQAEEWIANFHNIDKAAFKDKDDRFLLLGNLLVIERFVNTLRQGLADSGKEISAGLARALNLLWNYLWGTITPFDFQDFANDLYACMLANNVGIWEDDAPREFYLKYIGREERSAYEWLAIEWTSVLLISLVGIAGGQVDFEDFQDCVQLDFYPVDEMVNILEDTCIALTNTPLLSHNSCDLTKAHREVRQTPLFQQVVACIQRDLKTALAAVPEQFAALGEEYRQYGIFPAEYAARMLEY